jgi:hypothetical protein
MLCKTPFKTKPRLFTPLKYAFATLLVVTGANSFAVITNFTGTLTNAPSFSRPGLPAWTGTFTTPVTVLRNGARFTRMDRHLYVWLHSQHRDL